MTNTVIDEINRIILEWTKVEKNHCIMYSGGLDSFGYIKLFERLGIRVPYISFNMYYNGELVNKRSAVHFNISDEIIDINIEEVINSSIYWDFIQRYKCCSPQLAILYYAEEICRSKGLKPIHGCFPEPVYIGDAIYLEMKHKAKYFYESVNFETYKYSKLAKMVLEHGKSLRFDKDDKKTWFKVVYDLDVDNRPKYHNFEDHMYLDKILRTDIFQRYQSQDNSTFIPLDLLDPSIPVNLQNGKIVIRDPIEAVHHTT